MITFTEVLWIIALAVLGTICAATAIGYRWGREDAQHCTHGGTDPYPAPINADSTWQRILDAWAADPTLPEEDPLTGTAPADDTAPDLPLPRTALERLADTGELVDLAYSGEIDKLHADADAWLQSLSDPE